MNATQPLSPLRRQLHLRLGNLRSWRDDLRTRIHLFEDDARIEFAELEPKVEHLERELTAAADGTTDAIAKALGKLSSAFLHLQKETSRRQQPA